MKCLHLAAVIFFAASPALAEQSGVIDEGPLSPCTASAEASSDASKSAPPWGVELASGFSKDELFDNFAQMKQAYPSILADYEPMLIEQCNLSLGTKLTYSVRIGTDSRNEADDLCTKLRASGGVCVVQKN